MRSQKAPSPARRSNDGGAQENVVPGGRDEQENKENRASSQAKAFKAQQIPTVCVETVWVMTRAGAFACGVVDVRRGRGFRSSYETGGASAADRDIRHITNWQWNYERGRQWALIVGPSVPLIENGCLSEEALRTYQAAKEIL
jgi:hypothetical protein